MNCPHCGTPVDTHAKFCPHCGAALPATEGSTAQQPVNDPADMRQELLQRIQARRASINAFVRDLERRGGRLTNLSIICSAVVTVLTAGPALGGVTFAEGVQHLLDLSTDSPVWRLLCLAAMLISIVATIATNMMKSQDVATRLSKAQAGNVALEGLETLVEFGQVPVTEAVKLYQQYISDIPFIQEQPMAAR